MGGRRFSILAAVTTRGFIFWYVVEGSVTHETIEEVFRTHLEPLVIPGTSSLILDNASIHAVDSTLAEMERIMHGRFKFVPSYSPRCSPVERGFSLIWRYVRDREEQAQRDPIGLIKEAFAYYSVTGAGGYKCRNHFSGYRHFHRLRLQGKI